MPRGVWFCWRIAKAPGIKLGTFLLLPIRRPLNSSLNSSLRSSRRNRSIECSPGRCYGWRDGSIRPSENCTRCSTNTDSTTSSIQRNSRRRSAFSRLLTPKVSAEQPKPSDNRRVTPGAPSSLSELVFISIGFGYVFYLKQDALSWFMVCLVFLGVGGANFAMYTLWMPERRRDQREVPACLAL